jgi:hypothetical protein
MKRTLASFAVYVAVTSIASAASIYDTTVLNNGPAAFFPLNETTGVTANNLADTNENGAYHNVVLGVPGGPDGSGGAYTPIGSYMGAPNYPALDATTGFTIEAWINVTSANANALGGIFALNRATNSTGIALWLNGDHPELGLNNGAANYAELSTGTIANGKWNQVAVTWSQALNGGAPLFYIDGTLVGNSDANTFTQALNVANGPALYIGAEFANQLTAAGRWFNGDIEDVSFYNRALTGTEIANDFAAATPEPASLALIGSGLVLFATRRLRRR